MNKLTCYQCGLIDFPDVRANGPHQSAFCKGCNKWIKHLIKNPEILDFTLYFGKYKGRTIASMLDNPSEKNYLIWLRDNANTLSNKQFNILNELLSK